MPSNRIRFAGRGGDEIDGLFVVPAAAERSPGIVLVHDASGLDPHLQGVAQRFAHEGFAVLAPELWSRESGAQSGALGDRRLLGDLEGALAWLAAHPDVDGANLAAVGIGLGGNYAFQLGCTSRRVHCVVDFAGPLVYPELSAAQPIQPLELALNLSVPLLAFFGAHDASIPPEHVERLRRALSQGAKDFEIVTYPHAGHGFFDDTRPTYRAEEARDAWQRMLAFLRERLVEG